MTDARRENAPGDDTIASPPLTRRRFMQGTVGVGAGVAAIWSAPSLRSVRPLQAAGSPPPSTVPVDVAGAPVATSTTTTTTTTTVAPAPGDPREINIKSGSLPVTGSEALELALIGSTAVFVGRTLMKRTATGAPPTETKYQRSADET